MRPVRQPWSLRSHLYRNLNAICCGIARRMRREIHDGQLWPTSGTNGLTECLFVAIRETGRRLQIDTHTVGAGDAGRFLQPSIDLARTGRLTEIETRGANGNLDRDLMRFGLDRSREYAARSQESDAYEVVGVKDRGFGVHGDLQMGM